MIARRSAVTSRGEPDEPKGPLVSMHGAWEHGPTGSQGGRGEAGEPVGIPDMMIDAIRDAVWSAVAPLDPDAVYLFGSVAAGQSRPTSDVDVALLVRAPLAAIDRYDLAGAMAAAIGRDVDLIDLRSVPTALQAQVIARGVPLVVKRHREAAEFAVRVLREYALLNEEREPVLRRMERERSPF